MLLLIPPVRWAGEADLALRDSQEVIRSTLMTVGVPMPEATAGVPMPEARSTPVTLMTVGVPMPKARSKPVGSAPAAAGKEMKEKGEEDAAEDQEVRLMWRRVLGVTTFRV